MWIPLLVSIIPEVVRGTFAVIRESYAARKAEEERKRAEAEARKHPKPNP